MKNLRLLLWLPVLFFVFSSCKKDKEAAPTKTALLTSKPWKVTGITVNPQLPDSLYLDGGTGYISNYFTFFTSVSKDCASDNIRKFSTTSSGFSFEQGTLKCGGNDVYGQGTWTLSTDEKTIALSFSGVASYQTTTDVILDPDVFFPWFILQNNTINYTIVDLSATSLSYTYSIGSYTFTETLSNQ